MTDEQNILIRVIAREQMPIGTRADPPRSAVSPLPSGLFLLLMFPAVVSAALASDPRAILFDFEHGVADWKGNVWGKVGQARAEAAAGARFGNGALRVIYDGTTKGASVVPPYFPETASWRGKAWDSVSFWARCFDDNAHAVTLHIDTSQPGTGFSANFTLQGRSWQRYEANTAAVWSREGLRVDWAAMKRFYFISYASVMFEVDQMVLEPMARLLPLDVVPVVLCPRVAQAPKVDGVLDDSCWTLAGRAVGFLGNTSDAPALDSSEVRLCCDDTYLFLSARLSPVAAGPIPATTSDDPEDSLALFFDPQADGTYYGMALTALGEPVDLSSGRYLTFDADWQVKTSRDAQGWTAEVAIPLRSLVSSGTLPVPGAMWDFSVRREGPVTDEAIQGPSKNRDRWGYLLFAGASVPAFPGPAPTLLDLSYGEYAVRWTPPEKMTSAQLATRVSGRDNGQWWSISTTDQANTGLEEPLLRLSHPVSAEAPARWSFSAVDAGNKVVAYAAGRFQAFPREAPRPKPLLGLLPQPKEVRPGQGRFLLPAQTRINTIGFRPEEAADVAAALIEPVGQDYGREWMMGTGGTVTLILAAKEEQVRAYFPADRVATFGALPEEGYLLEVTPNHVAIAGKSARGVFYGVQTFLQAVGLSTPVGERPACPALSVRDFPSLEVRAVSMSFPNDRWSYPNDAPFDPARFKEYIERTVTRHKINTLVLIVNQGIRLDSHPEIAAPQAWSKDQVRDLLQFARRHYLEVVPLVTVLGHANWFTLKYTDLWEEGDYYLACVSNPKTQQILTDVVTEVVDLFQPRRFHLGMDEARWQTLDVPLAQRCKLCAGKSKSEIFASQLARYQKLLKTRGIETMIWADMLLPEHNGGPPYNTAQALETIPRDVILCNWSTGSVPLSSKRFQNLGFRVIQSNSAGINRERALAVMGNMMGCWYKAPWLVTNTSEVLEFSYLPVLQSAERAWNPDTDLLYDAWALSGEFLANDAAPALTLVARSPAPSAVGPAQPVSLAGVANLSTTAAQPASPQAWFGLGPGESLVGLPQGPVTVGGLPFTLLPSASRNAVVFGAPPVSIPMQGKKGALAFLYGCHLPEELKGKFLDRFKQKEAIRGVLVGTLRVWYADRTTESIELRYGLNVLAWKLGDKLLPYCYGAAGTLAARTAALQARDPGGHDAFLFACDWGNPHPAKEIVKIDLVSAGTEATPLLLACSEFEL